MILDELQKQQIAYYVRSITRYRETFDELYDHVLSAMERSAQAAFHMSLAEEVINTDFGGAMQIRAEEENMKHLLYGSFSKLLKREVLNTFRFPAVINNLLICGLVLILYLGKASSQTLVLITIAGASIVLLLPLLLYVYKSYILERSHKPSVSQYALRYNALFGLNTATCVFYISFSWDVLTTLESGILVTIMATAYYFLSIFLRAYLRLYANALRLKLH